MVREHQFHSVDETRVFPPVLGEYHRTNLPLQRRPRNLFPGSKRSYEFHSPGSVITLIDSKAIYTRLSGNILTHDDIQKIPLRVGYDTWFTDQILDFIFEMIRQVYRTDETGIGIIDTATGQLLSGSGDIAMQEEYREMLEDKNWIFVPINDAYGQTDSSGQGVPGQHWSLLAIDRPNRKAHYVDSTLSSYVSYGFGMVIDNIARNLGNFYREQYEVLIDVNAPNQSRHNIARDPGACGPYVIYMVSLFVQSMTEKIHTGNANSIGLSLHHFAPQHFQQTFDSGKVRQQILNTIEDYHRRSKAN